MNLGELAKTVKSVSKDYQEGSVEYEGDTISFLYRTEETAADFEFIMWGAGLDDDGSNKSIMARRVHRMVRDTDGTEFPYEQVASWPPSLLLLISPLTIDGKAGGINQPKKKGKSK